MLFDLIKSHTVVKHNIILLDKKEKEECALFEPEKKKNIIMSKSINNSEKQIMVRRLL